MAEIRIDSRKLDVAVAIAFLCMSAVAYYITTTWIPPVLPGDPGPAFFPRIAIGIIAIFSVLLVIARVRALSKPTAVTDAEDDRRQPIEYTISIEWVRFVVAFLFSAALVAGIAYFGLEIPLFLFLFILLGLRTGRWLLAAATAVVSVALTYIVFVQLLYVRLPLLFLPEYIDLNPF